MGIVPKSFFMPRGFFTHVIILPLFTLGILLLFCPFRFMSQVKSFGNYSFHATIISCIVLMTVLIVRIVLMLLHGKVKITWAQCHLSSFVEIGISAGFSALYIWLTTQRTEAYFWVFGSSFLYLFVILVIPNIVIDIYYMMQEKEERLRNITVPAQGDMIRFADENGNVKLVVASDAILYIQSDENYLKICYINEEKQLTFSLRNSMKKIADVCEKNGLLRCHRSYYINRFRITALQKNKGFLFAIMDFSDDKGNPIHIPVSRNYYDQIASML